jgi:hypothetical protein
MLFKKKAVHSEKPVSKLCVQIAELLIIKIGGTHSYYWTLRA